MSNAGLSERKGLPVLPPLNLALVIFLCALPVGLVARTAPGWGLPFWFDETFTGTIASQGSFRELLAWCRAELTGPAFYMPMWLWAKVAGTGNTAMRAPALLLSLAAPLLIARYGHGQKDVRIYWAALTLLWLPILPLASEARPYPQLFFLGALQAILFMKLWGSAKQIHAFWWATVTALAVLTHSYAVIIGGLQGVLLLIRHRRVIFSFYAALVPLIVMFAWMAFHLPNILTFASGHVAHYDPIRPEKLLALPMFFFGDGIHGYVLLGLIAFTFRKWKQGAVSGSPEATLIWSAVISSAVIVGAGLFGPTLMTRYLTPAIPALLFGVACWASQMQARNAMLVRLAFVALFAGMLVNLIGGPQDIRFRERRYFQLESASKWLMERGSDKLHFLWSTPTGAQAPSENLAEVAGFFFEREGKAVPVIVERSEGNPSAALAAAAAATPEGSILWISDDRLPASAAPMIEQIDRRWECRDFGGGRILVHACRRRLP